MCRVVKIYFATSEYLTGRLLKSNSLWMLDSEAVDTVILWKSVNPFQSAWHTIQKDLNLQNFIMPAIICINLGTKAIEMFLPINIIASSQTMEIEYILELRIFMVDLVVPHSLLWVCCSRLWQTICNSIAMERRIREIQLLHSLQREWCQL